MSSCFRTCCHPCVIYVKRSRERAGKQSSEHWSVSKLVASNAAAESKHCFISISYWRATWTARIERRVCFLRASWRFLEQRIFCYYDISRWMLWGVAGDGFWMDNVAEKLECKRECMKIWTVGRMQIWMAEFREISGKPTVSNMTGTILVCAGDRSLACPRMYLIRISVLGATIDTAPPTGHSHSRSHRRDCVLLDRIPYFLVYLKRARPESEYTWSRTLITKRPIERRMV